jgi:hypothetical protein
MSLAAALLALAVPSAESSAVVALYQEACVKGEFRLDPARGSLAKWDDLPEIIRRLRPFNYQPDQSTYVRMSDPVGTYLIVHRYGSRPGRIASECIVASRRINFKDAERVFQEGGHKARPIPSPHGFAWWDIDMIKKGYRKTLYLMGENFVVLQTTLFRGKQRPGAAAKEPGR